LADDTRKKPARKPSIASHRLFPVIVLLWFGALFGLASLAIRPALLQGVVAAAGIDRVVPMAAPPLGHTARFLIVLMMTALGCLIGAVVGRRLARPMPVRPAPRRRGLGPKTPSLIEDASPVRSFGASADEAAQDAEDEDEQPLRRRRQLALLPDDETFEDRAPLPGNPILSVSELPLKSFDEVDEIWLHSSDRAPARGPDRAGDTEGARDTEGAEGTGDLATDRLHREPPIAMEAEEPTQPTADPLFDSYVRRVNASVEGGEHLKEPVPGFTAIPPIDVSAVSEDIAQDHAGGPRDEPAQGDAAYANTAERIAKAPLDSLSHVELLERLGQTIARRRAQATRAESVRPDPAAPAAQALRATGDVPAALRPHWLDQADADDEALPAAIPARTIPMKPVPAASPHDTRADTDILAQGYSSLRGMTRFVHQGPADQQPAAQDFVRIDEQGDMAAPQPPVFAFPGLQEVAATPMPERRAFDAPQPGEPAADQTEQALRAALATLRRMSGTG
jgi:hypothetical protein